MSDLLSIGASGLAAYRNALSAVGENVANADTPGYARRAVVLNEVQLNGHNPGYRNQIIFGGVTTVGVARAWDDFKAAEARQASAASGRADTRQQWLTSVESALNDGPTGVGSSMTNFFTSATVLAGDPTDPLNRSAMLTSLGDVTRAFRTTGDALARVSGGITDAAKLDVGAVNDALGALYNLNGAIRTAAAGGTARASLEDQRDQLIDFVSSKLDVTATINDDGTANLSSTSASQQPLILGTGPGLISLQTASDGRIGLNFSINGTTIPLPAAGGTLAGYVDTASQVADRRGALDALATDFAATVNAWSAGGVDANGNAGGDLLSAPTGASSLQVTVTDPDLIAAASPGPTGSANGNLLALDAVRASSDVEGRWAGIVSGNAQVLASAKSEASAADSWRDFSKAALDDVTGIDLDKEASDLLRYQQAYSASARIIQVARETINDLFNALG